MDPVTDIQVFDGLVEIGSNLSIAGGAFHVDTVSGRIGIGSTIPQETIDISGTLKVNSLVVNGVSNSFLPVGAIVIWSGTTGNIPSGWALCDGAGGRPNLRDRFVMSSGSTYNVSSTGGATSFTMTATQMPVHTHTGNTNSNNNHNHNSNCNNSGAHSHSTYSARDSYGNGDRLTGFDTGGNDEQRYYGKEGGYSANAGAHNHGANSNSSGGHSHSYNTNTAGGGAAFNYMPPYYTLAYIIKL